MTLTFKFNLGETIKFNNSLCILFRKRNVNNLPGYLMKNIDSGRIYDNILEKNITQCTNKEVIDIIWGKFTYSGNNDVASKWIVNNCIKYTYNISNLKWGPVDSTNNEYYFQIESKKWTKNKTSYLQNEGRSLNNI
jgi:hypothetical protein